MMSGTVCLPGGAIETFSEGSGFEVGAFAVWLWSLTVRRASPLIISAEPRIRVDRSARHRKGCGGPVYGLLQFLELHIYGAESGCQVLHALRLLFEA